jgi:hypothetical protein
MGIAVTLTRDAWGIISDHSVGGWFKNCAVGQMGVSYFISLNGTKGRAKFCIARLT